LTATSNYAASVFAPLPRIERVDQVEAGPRNINRWIGLASGESVGHELKALVIGKPGSSRMPRQRVLLSRGRIKRKPERRVAHITVELMGRL
jgi:hypothetical protein